MPDLRHQSYCQGVPVPYELYERQDILRLLKVNPILIPQGTIHELSTPRLFIIEAIGLISLK